MSNSSIYGQDSLLLFVEYYHIKSSRTLKFTKYATNIYNILKFKFHILSQKNKYYNVEIYVNAWYSFKLYYYGEYAVFMVFINNVNSRINIVSF